MKKLLVTLQVLACCSLAAQAQDDQAANSSREMKKSDSCKKETCPKDPCFCFQRGDDPIEGTPMTCKYPAAYNHPANTKVENCWDIYADVTYLYWFSKQEGLNLATYGVMAGGSGGQLVNQPTQGFAVFQDAKYNSAFKAGFGFNLGSDDWVADAEYTYYRNTTHTTSVAPVSTAGTGVLLLSGWYLQNNNANFQGAAASQLSSKWKLGIDWIDVSFRRPFYQGKKLTITPSAGLRASWIRQNVKVASNVVNYNSTTQTNVLSHNHSNSWGIGPRMLMDAHWILGAGFRFQGNIGGSLLYTQYTSVGHREDQMPLAAGGLNIPLQFNITNYDCVRPMFEANLGMGWGGYFSMNKYHFDLSATYDFNYLWSQNMIRYLLEMSSTLGNQSAPLDLLLHGLSVKARFDF